jgi:hypothetical protein
MNLDPAKNICVYCYRDQGTPEKLEKHMTKRNKKCLQIEKDNLAEFEKNYNPDFLLKLIKEDFDKRIEISSNISQEELEKIRQERRHIMDL